MTRLALIVALTLWSGACSFQTCTTYLVRPSFLGITAPTSTCEGVTR